MSKTTIWLDRALLGLGAALIIAGVGDYTGHLIGRVSPHPPWAPLIFIALGILLLAPERLREGADVARKLLPWFKPEHNRRHDDPPIPGGDDA